jgi:hypothetical protein
MSAGLEAVTETTSDIVVDVTLLSRLGSADHGLGARIQEILEVGGSASETRLGRGLDLATGSLVGLHGRALILELGAVGITLGVDVVRTLDPLESETAVDVPDNVAMHQPSTWVVGLETDDGVACESC